jgi:RHS repeat-associated protein
MSLRSRLAGLSIAAVGLAAVLLGPGTKPALALTGPCVWNEAKQDWDYPDPSTGHSCSNDSYSLGTQEGYVATRGAILEGGKPVWAEYEPDQYIGGQFAPGVPTRIAVADGVYENAQVLGREEVAFAVERYNQLHTAYYGKFDLVPRAQFPPKPYKDNQNHDLPPPRGLNPRTLFVMLLRQPYVEPNTDPVLAELPLNPEGLSDVSHTNYLIQTQPGSGLGSVLYHTGGQLVTDTSGHLQEGTISYLSAFFSEVSNDAQVRWGFCKDYNSGNYATGQIGNTLTRDDVFAFADCDAHRIGNIWAPLAGAWVDSASSRMLGGGIPTQANGGYTLSYLYLAGYSYWDTMFVTLNYQPLDVRSILGSRWYIQKKVQAGAQMELDVGKLSAYASQVGGLGISFGTSAANVRYTGGNDNPLMGAVNDGVSTDTHKPRSVNFPVEVAYMNGWIQYVNPPRPGIALNAEPLVSIAGDDGSGELSSAPPQYSKAAVSPLRKQVPIDLATGKEATGGTGGGPTIDRVIVPEKELKPEQAPAGLAPDGSPNPVYDDALLLGLSRTDFANTDVHVFGPGGDLVTSRIGLRQNESPGLTCDIGKLSPSGTPLCTVTESNPAAFTPIADFIRNRYPGARYKVVIVNRSTGYVGTGYVSVGGDGLNGLQAYEIEGNAGPHSPIFMRPPNLKVEVKRAPRGVLGNDVCRSVAADQPCEQIVGFEGAGLTDDQYIIISTEWLDWDGSPLPSSLPGFTGRLSRVTEGGKLITADPGAALTDPDGAQASGTGADKRAGDLSHFQIRPNRRTQVVRLGGDANAYHYYLHVSGANGERCGKATSEQSPSHETWEWFTENSPACASFAQQVDAQFNQNTDSRPARFVPIKVPVFDGVSTAQALDLRIQNARAQAAGSPQSQIVVPPVDPIYAFVYRSEAQFSVYDLKEFTSPQVVTKFDPNTNKTKTTLKFGYSLGTSEGLNPLDPLGSQKDPTWSLGFDELIAAVNQSNAPAEWDDLDSLLRLSPAEQVAKLNGLVDQLSPSAYLALQLYLANDRGNPLYQDFDVPYLLQMSAEPIVLTRRENLGAFAAQATLPPVLESYRPIPFVLLRGANVTVSAIDESGSAIELSHPKGQLAAGLHYFVLDGSKLGALALGQAFTLRFEASLPPNEVGAPASQFPSHTVDISVTRDVVRSNRALGEVVEHDVNILDGSLRLSRQDFSLPGLGPELSLQRNYSNLHGETEVLRGADDESDLGPGWSHTLNLRLSAAAIGPFGPGPVPDWVGSLADPIVEPAVVESHLYENTNELSAVSVNGVSFIRVNGAWVGEQGRQAKLVQNPGCGPTAPEDCFQYVARDGTRYFYDYPRAAPPSAAAPSTQNPALIVPGGLAERLGSYQAAAPSSASGSGAVLPVVPVKRIQDRFGNTMRFHYDPGDGRLDRVEDATNRVCQFSYTPSVLQDCDEPPSPVFKRLRSVTCLAGVSNSVGDDISLTVNYCYDKDGNLAKASRGKELERYQYKHEGELTGGNFNLWKLSDALDATRTFTYMPGHGTVSSGIDPAVHFQKEDMVESIEFPGTVTVDGPVKPVVHFKYGASDCTATSCTLDNTRTVTDPRGRGLKKVYLLNQHGNPVRIDEPKGKYTKLVWSEDDPNAGCDDGAPANGHALMMRTVNRGDKLIVTRFGYDSEGNLTSECGAGGYTQTWDKFGLLASHTDFHNTKQTWAYDDQGFLLKHIVDAGRDAFTTEYTADPTKLGRVSTATVKAAAGDRVTRYSYDAHGNLASSSIDGASGSTIRVQHDARGRVELAYDRGLAVTKYHYDTNDHVEHVELPADVTKTGVDHIETQLHYSYDRAGNQLTETDRNGLQFTYAYTPQRQVKSVTRAADVEGPVTRFLTYDELGNVTSEQDWAGVEIFHTYDDLGFREVTTNRAKDEMVAKHDLLGNLISLTDFGGLETTYTYDDLNRELDAMPRCSDSPDCVVRQTRYEVSPNLSGARYTMSVTDGGRTFYTGFDSRGLEVLRKDPIGGIYRSNYDELGLLRSTIDEARFLTKFDYDSRGYLTKTTALGVDGAASPIVSTVTPDPNGNAHEVRRWREAGNDATLILTTTDFDAWNRARNRTFSGVGVDTASESFKYDGNGNLVEHTDTGNRTRFWHRDKRGQVRSYTNAEQETRAYEEFDANGNAHLVRDARSVETTLEYDLEERVKMVWEGSNRPGEDRKLHITARDGLGNVKAIEDFRVQEHTFDYTARHRLKSEKHPGKPPIVYQYTVSGAVDQITDSRNLTRKFGYDGLDRVQDVFFPDAQTRESHTEYDAVGNVKIRLNRRNTTTENAYDELLRVRQVNRFRGSGVKTPVLTNGYDDLGNVTSTTDASGVSVQFRYNNLNQLTKTVYAPVSNGVDPDASEDLRSEFRTYYPSGALETVTLPHDANEQPFSVTYEYDKEDRLTAKHAAGELTSFTYDANGNLKTLTKPEGQPGAKFAGKFRQFDYDALNRLEYVTDEVNLKTKYVYDSASNLRHVYGPYQGDYQSAPHVEYKYDPRIDRVTERLQYQEGPTLVTSFDEYDAHDNVKTLTDPLRRTFHYSYDHYDRVTHSDYQDDPSTPYYRPQSVDIDFNDDANITTVSEHKKDPDNNDVVDTTVEERDLLFDRLVHSNQRGVIVDYDYYANGNRKSVSTPGGLTSYTYDARNRLAQTSVNGAPTTYTYHQDGRLERVDLANVTTTTYAYFPTQRVRRISHQFEATTRRFTYDYDKNGNTVSALDETLDNVTGQLVAPSDGTSFEQYDAADRLLKFSQAGNTTTYGYERYNRKIETVTGRTPAARNYDYDQLSERLKKVTDTVADTVTTYTSDDNGNVLARETRPGNERLDFKYDVLNQLKRVTRGPPGPPPTTNGLYDYDAQGRRVRQDQTDRGQVESTYDGISVLEESIRSLPASAATRVRYHYDGSSILAQSAGGTDEYFHQDNLGSTANRSDGFANPTGDFKYDPFGGIRSQPEAKSSIAFTGQQFDQSTGLYYYGARFYDPALGRFLSQDTYAGQGARPESLQKYLYAYSNPAKFVDPTGHSPDCPPGYHPADVKLNGQVDPNLVSFQPTISGNCVKDEAGGGSATPQPTKKPPPPKQRPRSTLPPPRSSAPPASPRDVPPHYTITNADLDRWYAGSPHHYDDERNQSAEDPSGRVPTETQPVESLGTRGLALANGLATGFLTGIGTSAAIGALQAGAAIFAPALAPIAAPAAIIGLLGYGVWELSQNDGAGFKAIGNALLNTFDPNRTASAQDLNVVGNLAGGLLSGKFAKPATNLGTMAVEEAAAGVKSLRAPPSGFEPPPPQALVAKGVGAQAAEGGAGERVFRFATRSAPETLQSNLSRAGGFTRFRVKALLQFRAYRSWRAHEHMRGNTRNSPFVSVVESPTALAHSTDPWARTIVTGRPGMQGVKRAPDLGEFNVPRERLYGPQPDNALSIAETEQLFLGDDLADFLTTWRSNPF